MPVIVSWADVKDPSPLFIHMRESDLSPGESLEGLVSPPKKNVVEHADGSVTWTQTIPPFNWRYTDDSKVEVVKESPLLVVIITVAPLIKMGSITEANWKEFWVRLRIYEQAFGSFYEGYRITPRAIRGLVGLTANVNTKPREVFMEDVSGWLEREAEHELVGCSDGGERPSYASGDGDIPPNAVSLYVLDDGETYAGGAFVVEVSPEQHERIIEGEKIYNVISDWDHCPLEPRRPGALPAYFEETCCRTCGGVCSGGGDGYDGECPGCADKAYVKEIKAAPTLG
jgi:hypothetical protein